MPIATEQSQAQSSPYGAQWSATVGITVATAVYKVVYAHKNASFLVRATALANKYNPISGSNFETLH